MYAMGERFADFEEEVCEYERDEKKYQKVSQYKTKSNEYRKGRELAYNWRREIYTEKTKEEWHMVYGDVSRLDVSIARICYFQKKSVFY